MKLTITEKEWRAFNSAISDKKEIAISDDDHAALEDPKIRALVRLRKKLQPFVKVSR